MIIVLDGAATILKGEAPDSASAPHPVAVAGSNPVIALRERDAIVRAALQHADLDQVMETPMGPMSAGSRVAFPAMDLHLHAWDLGQVIGRSVQISDEVVKFARDAYGPLPPELVRSEGIFGPEVPAPADATVTEALVAWTGRRPR